MWEKNKVLRKLFSRDPGVESVGSVRAAAWRPGSMATFAASLGNIDRVDVLPFHQMGEHKWRELGLNYKLAGKPTPTPEAVDRVRKTFRAAGLLVS